MDRRNAAPPAADEEDAKKGEEEDAKKGEEEDAKKGEEEAKKAKKKIRNRTRSVVNIVSLSAPQENTFHLLK